LKRRCQKFVIGLVIIGLLFIPLSLIRKITAKNSVSIQNDESIIEKNINETDYDKVYIEDEEITLEENYADFVPVLCYHHIIPGELPETATTKAVVPLREFEEQMKFLHENDYNTIKLEDLDNFIYKKQNLPEKSVLITFDDGYESNYVYALPIMQKYNLNFAIFLIGKEVKEENEEPWNPDKLSNLTLKQIEAMAATGLVEFGNHTYDLHRYINKRPAIFSKAKEEISNDLKIMADFFECSGLPSMASISYPFGVHNETLLEQVKEHGYKLGFTIEEGRVYRESDPYKLGRLVVPPWTNLEEFQQLLN